MKTKHTAEFSFVKALPEPPVRPSVTPQAAFDQVVREYEAAQTLHGVLVPISTVAECLGVSSQRVLDLLNDNRLEAAEICGRRWVISSSVKRHLAEAPRKPGRPRKEKLFPHLARRADVLTN